MRISSAFTVLAAAGIGSWWLWSYTPLGETVQSYVENGEFLTLEARYSAEQIMEAHRNELLPGDKYSFKEPTQKFYPYLFMEVKYPQINGKTKEGVILWSMVDGEMVLDAATWQTTHGFDDAINAGANQNDFLLLNTLAAHRGALIVSRLQSILGVDDHTMKQMLDSAIAKHLVIMRGNEAALHFQNPQFNVPPNTRMTQSLVTKPYDLAQRISKRYTQRQIERVEQAAFVAEFAVRSSRVVYLPVYSIEVLNPDGSVMTSYWNALTSQRLRVN
jgi:hypothetical protein